jgi:hypothetical protein
VEVTVNNVKRIRKGHRIALHISDAMRRQLEALAAVHEVSMSHVVRDALKKFAKANASVG